jgi:hypothetical protein
MGRAMKRSGAVLALCVLLTVAPAAIASAFRPVSRKVLAAVNAAGEQFVLAPHGRPGIPKRIAVHDAVVASAPWRGCATGISLARTTKRSQPSAAGTLVWLVSIHATERVGPAGGGPAPIPGLPTTVQKPRAANYFLVAVNAADGRFVEAQDGYSPRLPRWTIGGACAT